MRGEGEGSEAALPLNDLLALRARRLAAHLLGLMIAVRPTRVNAGLANFTMLPTAGGRPGRGKRMARLREADTAGGELVARL